MNEFPLARQLPSAIANAIAGVPAPEWPVFVIESECYLHKYYWLHVINLLKRLDSMLVPFERVAEALSHPSRIAAILTSTYGLRYSGLSRDLRAWLVERLIRCIAHWRQDPFCSDGRNWIWNEIDVQNVQPRLIWLENNLLERDYKQLIGKINATLFSWCELIHVGQHFASHEYHGPYPLPPGRILIVREYHDLKPVEVWGFTRYLPFDSLQIAEVYQDIDIRFDLFNHMYASSSLSPKLLGFCAEMGRPKSTSVEIDELRSLLENLVGVLRKGVRTVENFSKRDWYTRFVEMHYHNLRACADMAAQDWRPSQAQYEILAYPPDATIVQEQAPLQSASSEEAHRIIEKLYWDGIFE